jgi:hypothetical protein
MKTTKYTSTNVHRVQQSKDRLNYSKKMNQRSFLPTGYGTIEL